MEITFTEQETIKLQSKMLEILKYFVSICEANKLRYWLGGGTCLGAERHKGFIPWDDDIDVFMPRPDYEIFYKLLSEKKDVSKYVLCRTNDTKNYHHRVIQLLDPTTTFINERCVNEDIEHGIYIDIIPMDAAANKWHQLMLQRFYSVLFSVYNIQCLPKLQGGLVMKALIRLMLLAVKSKEKRYLIWKLAETKMTKYNWESSRHAIELTTSFSSIFKLWNKAWFETEKIKFEDFEACVPAGRQEYMTKIYGDYMQFPPAEKRVARHSIVYMDLNNSYLQYKGVYYLVKKEKK